MSRFSSLTLWGEPTDHDDTFDHVAAGVEDVDAAFQRIEHHGTVQELQDQLAAVARTAFVEDPCHVVELVEPLDECGRVTDTLDIGIRASTAGTLVDSERFVENRVTREHRFPHLPDPVECKRNQNERGDDVGPVPQELHSRQHGTADADANEDGPQERVEPAAHWQSLLQSLIGNPS
ncbi:VOC family protein [Haladaptatus sp. NG-WS-4]